MNHHDHLSPQKQKALKSVRQAQGTLGKVLQMVESDTYCPNVIQQIDSIVGLLKTTRRELLVGHMHTCLEDELHKNKDKAIGELVKIFNLS